jgi:hypothetical protein
MKGEINKMEYLLQIGKTFGFSALILFAIGWFFYQLYKSQEKRIDGFMNDEKEEKNKLMDILNVTLAKHGDTMLKISSTLERIELNMTNNNNKIGNIENKLNLIDEKIIHIEAKIDNK